MYLDSKQLIADYPSLKIRDLLKKSRDFHFSMDHIANKMKITFDNAKDLIVNLLKLDYIEKSEEHKKCWKLTDTGQRLSTAKGFRMKKETADKIVQKLLQKVNEVNQNKSFDYFILYIIIFGSYAKETPYIGDLDINIQIMKNNTNLNEAKLPTIKTYKPELIKPKNNSNTDSCSEMNAWKKLISSYINVHRKLEDHDTHDLFICGEKFDFLYIDDRIDKQKFTRLMKIRRKEYLEDIKNDVTRFFD